jgi:hypothetical protein
MNAPIQQSPRPTNEQLSDLYPTPKTFDEIEAENNARQKRIAARAPQHIVATTSLRLYSIYALIGLVLFAIPDLVVGGSIYGVALSFLFGIAWLGYTAWILQYILQDLYALAISATTFFSAYIICISVPLALGTFFVHPSGAQQVLLILTAISMLHFVVTWAVLKFALSQIKKQ